MSKIIYTFLAGIIVENFLSTDKYFLVFILIFIFISFLIKNFYKGQTKSIKDILKEFLFINFLFLSFCFSVFYTKHELELVSYKYFEEVIYKVTGIVEQVKHINETQTLMVRVEDLEKLTGNDTQKPKIEYLNISVSPLDNFTLFEKLNFTGEIVFNNSRIYKDRKPMFQNYEFMKLDNNVLYTVSSPKNIFKIPHEKNFYETGKIKFHVFSETIKSKISLHMNEPYGSIAEGITLGEQDNLLKDIKDIFKNSGLIHILVLSGANVMFVISLIWHLLKNVKNKFLKIFSAVSFSWIFIFMTGFTAPSARAGFMASTNILAEYLGKNILPSYSLLFLLFLITLVSPLSLIYSPSLHLSFLACVGLFIITPKIENYFSQKFSKRFRFLKFMFASFVGIFICVTPYILALTGQASLFGTFLTFLVEPFAMLTTIFSFLIILFSFINFYAAEFFGLLTTIMTKIILSVAEFGANNLPIISFEVSKIELIIYYLVLFFVINFGAKLKK